MKRHSLSKKQSKRSFSKHASKTHVKNTLQNSSTIMRGGIRL